MSKRKTTRVPRKASGKAERSESALRSKAKGGVVIRVELGML